MIFDAIRESHDLQRDLCRKLTASRGDMAARQVLFLQLKVELMAHAAAEERHLYVPLLMDDGGLDASRHALHEHHEIDELLDDLSVGNKKEAGWIATAKTLSFKVRHHLKEEETKFFPLAGRLLSMTKKRQLAREYKREIVRMPCALRQSDHSFDTQTLERTRGNVHALGSRTPPFRSRTCIDDDDDPGHAVTA